MKKLILAAAFMLALSGCSVKTEGAVGETLKTMFFDITVNSAYKADELNEMKPMDEGNNFAVVNVTVKNTTDEAIPMGGVDFVCRWGTGKEECDYPMSVYSHENLTGEDLSEEYTLQKGETVTGNLVYIVPESSTSFQLQTTETYTESDEGEMKEGETFTIIFNAENPK